MKKIVLSILSVLLIISNLNADNPENLEYNGCFDIFNAKKDTQNAKYVENLLNTNIKIKEDFLKSLGFNITKTIDYKIVCSALIINFNKTINEANMVTNIEYKNYLLNQIEKEKELSFGHLNKLIHRNLLEVNNLTLQDSSDKLNNRIKASK